MQAVVMKRGISKAGLFLAADQRTTALFPPQATPQPKPDPLSNQPRRFHGTTAFNCPSNASNIYIPEDGSRPAIGAPPDLSIGVLLGGMNKVLSVDKERHLMRVQSGMTIKQLLDEATARGMSVPLGSVTAFADLMVGGVLLTGAHGSNYRGKSNLGDLLQDLTWVDARGETRHSARDSVEGRAIVGGLGLLGVLTEVTLLLGPPSNTRFSTVWKKDDGSIAADIFEMLKATPRMLIVWRPDLHKYNAVRLEEVPLSVKETGATQTIQMPEWLAAAGGATIRTWEVGFLMMRR